MCVSYKIGDPLPDKLCVAALDSVAEGKSTYEVGVTYVSKPVVCKGCNSLGHHVGACPSVKRVWVLKQKIGETSSHSDDVQSENPATHPVANEEPSNEGEWTTVKGKSSKVSVRETSTPAKTGTTCVLTEDSPSR